MKSIKTLLTLILGLIIIIFAIILSPLIKIRFGYIITSRIGQLCYNLDNYLSHKKTNNLDELAIFNYDKKISNKLIFKLFSKKKNIIFSKIASSPIIFLKTIYPLKYHSFHSIIKDKTQKNLNYPFIFRYFISHIDILHPRITNYSMMPSNINLDKFKFKELGLFQELKKDRFICFHNRDEAYQVINDANNHDFRNFDFNDYSKAIELLTNLNMFSVRIGRKILKPFEIESKNFFDMTEEKSSEIIDIQLINECLFFVGTNSGISNVCRIIRKPSVLINYIPFKLADLSAWASNSLFITKKYFLKKESRYMKFFEMDQLKYNIHYKGNFFSDNEIEIVNNSKDEIAEAISEMYYRKLGLWKDTLHQAELQKKFWNSMKCESDKNIVRNELKMFVGSKFLERNSYLI